MPERGGFSGMKQMSVAGTEAVAETSRDVFGGTQIGGPIPNADVMEPTSSRPQLSSVIVEIRSPTRSDRRAAILFPLFGDQPGARSAASAPRSAALEKS